MKITKTTLLEMLGEAGARYVIPVYQRAYSWTESQCDAFWDDAVQTARDRRPHYTGVSLYRLGRSEGAGRSLILVDGQQRLATARSPRAIEPPPWSIRPTTAISAN